MYHSYHRFSPQQHVHKFENHVSIFSSAGTDVFLPITATRPAMNLSHPHIQQFRELLFKECNRSGLRMLTQLHVWHKLIIDYVEFYVHSPYVLSMWS